VKAHDLKIEGWRRIGRAAFSPDGQRVAAVRPRRVSDGPGNLDDHLVRAWDLATGKEIFAVDVRNTVYTSQLAFTPDGKRLLATFSSLREGTYCWEIATGRLLWQNKEFGHSGFVFTPDGKILSSQQRPRAVDLETGRNVEIPGLPALEHRTELTLVPDGRTLLLANSQGVRIWDLKAGKELRMLKGVGKDMVVTPDGRSIITNSGVLQRWDLATGKPVWTDTSRLGHSGEVTAVVFSADGKRLVSTSTDGTVRLWDATTGRPLRVWRDHPGRRPQQGKDDCFPLSETLDISADGRRVVSAGSDKCLEVWDIDSDKEVRTIPLAARDVHQVRISPDGSQVFGFFSLGSIIHAAGEPASKLTEFATWDAGTGELLEVHSVEPGRGSHILSRDGATLLTGDTLRDIRSSREIARLPDVSGGEPVAFSRDGALVIGSARKRAQKNGTTSVESDGLRVWETATGKVVARLKTKPWVVQTAFHPDSRFIVTNDLDGIQFRDIRTGKVVARLEMPEAIRCSTTLGSYAGCLTFTPDGRRLATGHPDSTILLWDVWLPPDTVEPLAAKELEALWADLAGEDAAKAWEAVWRLAEAPKEALAFLRGRIQPSPTAPADETRRLLADLDDAAFARREAATKRLKELGLKAEPALRAALRGKLTLEPKRRIEGLLAELVKAPQPLAAEDLRQLRGLVVLERVGTAEARRVLEAVARGPESARLTRQGQAALAALR
jgi:WD40 repeat protein